jgi:HK97 family phage portal protein
MGKGKHVEKRAAFRDIDIPNDNTPADAAPGTVGPPSATPGDPDGVGWDPAAPALRPASGLPRIPVAAWSGWPAEWNTPDWSGKCQSLTDTAWTCLDSNASILSTMPPYLVGAADSLSAGWLSNPDPDQYASWEEFAKQLFWDYQGAGEAFVLATAYYATGWPARFHVVAPWNVNAEIDGTGRRRYEIGDADVTGDMLHIRYQSRVGDAHGHGPLDIAGPRLVAASALSRYAYNFASGGGIPPAIITHPARLDPKQAADLQTQWVTARASSLGIPAVLSGGVSFETVGSTPTDAALVELSQWNDSRIAVLLGVPPFCVGLPSGGDSMTYSNVSMLFDYRWRAGLRPLAQTVMAALSGWALPTGTVVELNRDEFIRPGPLERAQTAQIWTSIGVLSPEEIRRTERFGEAAATVGVSVDE